MNQMSRTITKHNVLFLQVEAIKKIAEYVSQLRRVGKGHGMHIASILFHINPQTLPKKEREMISNKIDFLWLVGVWHFDQRLLHEEDGA